MKIGIITFYRPINIGAVLQATATNRIIFKDRNIKTELIDYRLPRTEFYRKPFNLLRPFKAKGIKNVVKALIGEFIFFPKRFKAYAKMNKFVKKYLIVTDKKYKNQRDCKSLNETFDVFLIGSDLVWNPIMSESLNGVFFADFAEKNKIVLSYAASVGQNKIDNTTLTTIADNICRFSRVSVREKTTAYQLQKISSTKIYTVLDPTLLTNEEDWEPFIGTFKYRNCSYIFVYMLENSDSLISFAERVAKITGYKIITYDSKIKFHYKNIRSVPTIGPSEFLDAIKNAKVVITNSLHGCAFSILFKKEFYAFPHSTRSIRMTDLLDDLHLSKRMITDIKTVDIDEKINYDLVFLSLNKLRDRSLDFIEQGLSGKNE